MNPERGDGADETRPAGEPASLSERLERRFGPRIDPSITLDAGSTPPELRVPRGGSVTPSDATPGSGELAPELAGLAVFDPQRRRYVPRGEIGRGGMGAVLEVWDRHLRRTIAMKVALEGREEESSGANATLDSKRVSRFLEEAQVTSQLDHPGIVPVHEIGMDPSGRVFFTMRRVAGRDLKAIFDLACASCEGWNLERALGVLVKVCDTLAYAHSKGVVHRDLKPANIMIGAFGEVYVMDWGLAKVLKSTAATEESASEESSSEGSGDGEWIESDRAQLLQADPDSELATLAGEIVGTPCYMAPEQARREQRGIDARSDIYSVGCLLYQLLARRRPYVPDETRTNAWEVLQALRKGPPVRVQKLNPKAPAELVAICEQAMARDPAQRYPDIAALAEDLRAYLEGRVVRAHAVGPWVEFTKWVGRNRAAASASAAAFLLLVGSALFFAWEQKSHAALIEEQRRAAERSELEAERHGYAATISAAAAALRNAEVREARRRLDETPPYLRGWEWEHLALRANASLRSGAIASGARAIAVHPRERLIAVGSPSGNIELVDTDLGEIVRRFEAHGSEPLTALAWSPDGRRLATGSASGALRVFAIDGVAPLALEGHKNYVTALAFSPDGSLLLSASGDFELALWDALNGRKRARALHDGEPFQAALFSGGPADPIIAAAGEKLLVWRPERQLLTESYRYPAAITALATSAEGELAIGLENGAVLRTSSSRRVALEGHADRVNALAFSPDGRWLASASDDRTLRVWNVAAGERAPRVLLGHLEAVSGAGFLADGKSLISCGLDDTWRLWSLDACEALTRIRGHAKSAQALAFAPAGGQLLSTSLDGSAALWDPRTGELRALLRGAEEAVIAGTYVGDGQRLATAGSDGTIRLWDARAAENTHVLHGHLQGVPALAASPDGALLASASWDGTLRLWDLRSGSELARYADHGEPLSAVAFHPQGRWLASGDRAGKILVRDLATGRVERELHAHSGAIGDLAFHPHLPLLASGGADETVRLFDLANGIEVAVLLGHDDAVNAVAFDPEGARLASGSTDRTVRLWSTGARASLVALHAHAAEVNDVAFSPDGSQLASASSDGAVLLHETRSVAERYVARQRAQQLRAAAAPRVAQLFEQHGIAAEVLDALRQDTTLDDEQRAAAMALAFERALSPRELNQRSWKIVRQVGQGPREYAEALRSARAARRGAVDDPQVLSTLGAALYRNGDSERAIVVLRQAELSSRAREGGARPADVAFLALAHWQLGQKAEARAEKQKLERLLEDPAQRSDADALALLEEVRAVVR
ncbi:MAG: protein kinase [Planctomycetes bacterium]|nr:protein kinase [Planctomycetota bacterium]